MVLQLAEEIMSIIDASLLTHACSPSVDTPQCYSVIELQTDGSRGTTPPKQPAPSCTRAALNSQLSRKKPKVLCDVLQSQALGPTAIANLTLYIQC